VTSIEPAFLQVFLLANAMSDPRHILESLHSALLVDWPHTGVPRTLLDAGFRVFGYSPGGFSTAELAAEAPGGDDLRSVIPPKDEGEAGFLVFRKLAVPPASVDLVCVYRPENELEGIIAKHVLPLGAKVLWLEPPIISVKAQTIGAERGFILVEGLHIAEAIRTIGLNR
jgi:hypothetical protein